MRLKISIILFAFLCGTVLFMFCGRDAEGPNLRPEEWDPTPEEIMARIDITRLSEEQQAEFKRLNKTQELAERIFAALELFRNSFSIGNFRTMGTDLDNRSARILKVNNEKRLISGARELEDYYMDAERRKREENEGRPVMIQYDIDSVTVAPLLPPRTIWDKSKNGIQDQIDMYIHIEFRYRIVPQNQKEEIKNEAGGGDMGCWHRQGCQLIC